MWGDRTEVSKHLQRAYALSIEYINFKRMAIAPLHYALLQLINICNKPFNQNCVVSGMKSRQFNIYLWLAATLVGIISTLVTQVASAQVKFENNIQKASVWKQGGGNQKIRQLGELEIPLTSAQDLLVQSSTPQTTPAPTIQITGVKANPTNIGVEVILETPVGTRLQVTNRSTGNNFIADVSGGQLRLPDGEAFTFRSQKLLAGIIEITVTNIDAKTVRVTVVGEKTLPTVELYTI